MAGRAGIPHYEELTLFELVEYLRGAEESKYDAPALICSVIASCNSTKRFSPADFHPYQDKNNRARKGTVKDFEALARQLKNIG